ncbi:helix-turn-helix domain-containing protein [Nevskia ramosa]|uniref:helix-turn-helix domain-containing protein n=1 Tax=Nevskia ramosa TaxID=64002 RepID=UPI0009FFDBAA
MKTLALQQAAELLHAHPSTIRRLAATGELSGAKVGRGWVFIEDDLIAYLRAQSSRRALQGEQQEKSLCRSTNVKTHLTGGSSCPTTAARYSAALALPTAAKPRSTTTSSRRRCGIANG